MSKEEKSINKKVNTSTKDNKKNSKVNKNINNKKDKKEEKKKLLFNLKSINKGKNKDVKNSKVKKESSKNFELKKFSFDILDILIMITVVAIITCITTGSLLNYQYKKHEDYLNVQTLKDDGVREFLNTYQDIVDNYYEEVDKNEMMKAAMKGMLEFLEDKYSIYLDKEQSDDLSSQLDGTYKGIGILVRGTFIEKVYEGSSAYEVGIKAGDEIIKVNDIDINLDNYYQISLFLDKKENSIVVKRKGKELTFKVYKSDVTLPATSKTVIEPKKSKKKIGYIQLRTFSHLAFEDFFNDLKELENDKKIDSLIIDLRSNSGGYLEEANNIANLFLEKGKIIYSLENKKETKIIKDTTDYKRNYKIVVLVDNNTASAAEILAAALKDSYGATLVGTTTFGKGKVQTVKEYEGNIVKYTSAKWLRPNGECIDKKGIKPDYILMNEFTETEIIDKQLEKAIELLK